MELLITQATKKEKKSILSLLKKQFETHHISMPTKTLTDVVEGVFSQPQRGCFLLAHLEKQAVGLAYLSFNWTLEHGGKCAWLEELFVLPKYRGQGLGQELLHKVFHFATEKGCKAIDLEVESSQARAENLYRREGFKKHQRNRWSRSLQKQN